MGSFPLKKILGQQGGRKDTQDAKGRAWKMERETYGVSGEAGCWLEGFMGGSIARMFYPVK